MNVMDIYNCLPIWGQNLACYFEGERIAHTRYGKRFWKYLSEYEQRTDWAYEQRCEFRDKRLRKIVHHSYETVPYYKQIFDEGGINPDSIRYLDDLKVLPILTKEIVNKQPEQFLSTAYPKKKMISAHTSGTTGAGFIFKTTQRAVCEQWAVWWRYRKNIGLNYGDWCALLGGRSVVPIKQTDPPYFRWNVPCNQIYFSTYHMNDMSLIHYVEVIKNNRINWIHGYPSAISILADYMAREGIRLDVKYITTGAENLMESQREKIRIAFGNEPYQHYGLSEGCANFSESISHILVVDEDFAAVEFIDNGNEENVIVGTNLTNFAMPFIRYNTGDLCAVRENYKGRCIISLDGRKEDYIVLANGTKVGRLDHIFKDIVNVREAQFIQNKQGMVTLKIVRNDAYDASDEKKLYHEIYSRLNGIAINIKYVDAIERTKNGKFRFVITE